MKRVVDLLGAAILIVVLAPLATVVALLTAIDVGLPIVFWQKRPGRNGHPFKLYKFRTMRGAHDQEGNHIPDRERSSSLGALLRRIRLDELPQLYNVLVGEMSLIGPRPLLPIDHGSSGRGRLLVRPGLTGWAQVNGGRHLSPEDKEALDVWYVQNLSLGLDTKIALRTCVVLVAGERVNPEAVALARGALALLAPRLSASLRTCPGGQIPPESAT
jgi:lipopolysaccharide/colanic/teichoic acid biosynthesis glycosyltransferase